MNHHQQHQQQYQQTARYPESPVRNDRLRQLPGKAPRLQKGIQAGIH